MSLLDEFAGALTRRISEPLPDAVVHETRRCVLNVLGTTIGASQYPEVTALVSVAQLLGASEIATPGRSEALDRLWAACVIGFAAHLDDFDDTHLETVIHPGAPTLGAVYSLGLALDSPSDLVLKAFALGVESQLRIGLAMSPSHYDLGWHITGTCGVIGAAVASSVLLGLDSTHLASAIGIATTMTLGHREAFGTPVKPLHAGKAASNGVLAASLAARGSMSPHDVLEAETGFFALLSDEWSSEQLTGSSSPLEWVLLDNTYKPYPCGIVAHPAIEAAIDLHEDLRSSPLMSIKSVTVRCNPLVIELMGRPNAATGLEARFCAAHGVAVGLLEGAGGLAQFSDERATDPAVVSLRERTHLIADERRARESASVTVLLHDDRSFTRDIAIAAGSKARPLSEEELLAKFVSLVEPVYPGRYKELFREVNTLGSSGSLQSIDQIMRGSNEASTELGKAARP